METWNCLSLLLLALPTVFSAAYPQTGPLLYKYGPSCGDMVTEILDDGGTDLLHMTHAFKFIDETHRQICVNNNGALSFHGPVPDYTPDVFPLPQFCMICPFWADVDNEIKGDIYYRQTEEPEFLGMISDDVNAAFPNLKYQAAWAFVVTWDKVAYHGSLSNKTNTFQCVLVSDKFHRSIVMFHYEDIEWTTGTASGGDAYTGFDGDAAQAGLNTGRFYFNLPLSRTRQIVNIKHTSNVGRPGKWIFRVDDELLIPGGCIHGDSFLNHGQTVWDSDQCTNKCSCRHDGKVHCDQQPCDEGMVCLPSGRNFMCQIDEVDC